MTKIIMKKNLWQIKKEKNIFFEIICVIEKLVLNIILTPGLIRDCIEKFKKSEENMGDEQMREFITWAQNCITNVIISN